MITEHLQAINSILILCTYVVCKHFNEISNSGSESLYSPSFPYPIPFLMTPFLPKLVNTPFFKGEKGKLNILREPELCLTTNTGGKARKGEVGKAKKKK